MAENEDLQDNNLENNNKQDENDFNKELEEIEKKLTNNKDFKELVDSTIDYYKQLSDIKVEELMMKENERLLKLGYGIYYEEAERPDEERMYVHEGVSCSKCGIKSIIGTRYLCSECEYFNLCPLCEKLNFYEKEYHEHNFYKIRKKEDMDKFQCDYKFEIDIVNNEIEKHREDNNNIYRLYFKNTGKKDWPKNTFVKCIPQVSNCELEENNIVGLKRGATKAIDLIIKNMTFSQKKEYCRCVITLYGLDESDNIIKFLSPFEIHFIEPKKEKEKEKEIKNVDNNI
jgi:hypothetical protein